MAAPYQHKRSTTAAAVPTLLDGELGINQRDGKLFWKDHNGTVQSKSLFSEVETATTVGALINASTDKATPVDADQIGLMDSAASNVLKKLSWANVKATLKAYFDTLYKSRTILTRTGMALVFDQDANYGYPSAETGSAFTTTDASAVLGVILKVRVNRATEPSYFSRATCISGTFKASVNNYYYFECVYVGGSGGSSNEYEYTISQMPV